MEDSRIDPSVTALESAPGEMEALPKPIVSISLLVVIVAVFVWMFIAGHGDVVSVARLFGDKENGLIRAGQWWRLITPIFLHGGWGHLIANGMTLLLLGIPMERIYGHRKFLLIYMLAGIAGNLFSFWFSVSPSLGASGALYGLMGAGLVFPMRFRDRMDPRARRQILTQLGRAAAINLAINFLPELHLDKWAHVGGMLGGGLAALVWIPDVLEEGSQTRAYSVALWAGTCGMLLLMGLAGIEQWDEARQEIGRSITLQTSFVTDQDDAWWGMRVPHDWRRLDTVQGEGMRYAGPGNAQLELLDSVNAPAATQQVTQFLEAHSLQLGSLSVDGKPAQHAVFSEGTPVGTRKIHLFRIDTDAHTLYLIFSVPLAQYAAFNPTFEVLVSTVRFIRPPTR